MYTLTTGTGGITVAAGAGAMTIGVGGGVKSTLNMAVSGNQIWSNNSNSQLTIVNTVTPTATSGTTTLTIDGSGAGGVLFSGALGDNGSGHLALTVDAPNSITEFAAANTYTGATTVTSGLLQLDSATSIPGGIGNSGGVSSIILSGGILGLANGDFGRGLGTGVAQVQFAGSGGFAAIGGARNVNFGNAGAAITWATTSGFLGDGQTLILSSTLADSTVTFVNPINFNNASRTIRVDNGTGSPDAIMSGVLSGTGLAGLTKSGFGVLSLTASNTYSGDTVVGAGTLLVGSSNAIPNGTGKGNVSLTGTLDTNGIPTYINGLSGGGMVNNSSATATTLTVGGNDQTNAFAGNITDTGGNLSLTKTGTGTQTLSGFNNYAGVTTVNAGTLVYSGSSTLAGGVTINGGAVIVSGSLGGSAIAVSVTGTLAGGANRTSTVGPVSVASNSGGGGTLAPGGSGGAGLASVGKLNVNGALSLGSASTTGKAHFVLELGGSSAGVSYDQVSVQAGSTLTLSDVNLEGSLINGYRPTVGAFNYGTNQPDLNGTMFFLVIGAGTISGTFSNQLAPDFYSGGYSRFIFNNQQFLISYTANFNNGIGSAFTGGHDVALIAVPEASDPLILLGGSAMLLFFQRLRRRTRRFSGLRQGGSEQDLRFRPSLRSAAGLNRRD